ncbi:MAG: hypothetical protein U0Q16_06140 [Bryobacteraceae bacterium]
MTASEFRCLIALEASLFFALPFCDMTVQRAWPTGYPFRFAVAVFIGATLAALLFHVGPALLARRLDGRMPRVLAAWFLIGYCEQLGWASQAADVWRGRWLEYAFPLLAGLVAWTWPRSRWIAVAVLAIAGSLLVWAFAVNLPGLSGRNPYWSPEFVHEQNEWPILRGMVLAAAPAAVIGWKTGGRSVWRAGFFGVWLPAVVAATLASLATEGGLIRHWSPSLPGGFNWALLEPPLRGHLTEVFALLFAAPSLVAAIALRESGRLFPALVLAAPMVARYLPQLLDGPELHSIFEGGVQRVWVASLALAGAIGCAQALGSPRRDQ